jgi:hypothetical protein
MITKECIILGGGYSVREGIDNFNLFNRIKNKFVIGTNYSYKFFDSTCLCFVDVDFYKERYLELHKVPLVIGVQDASTIMLSPDWEKKTQLILFNYSVKYLGREESLTQRLIYSPQLTGIFATTIAICLGFTKIYLLGFDFGSNPDPVTGQFPRDKFGNILSHWYQGMITDSEMYAKKRKDHRGIGNIDFFLSRNRQMALFAPFLEQKDVEIFTVGLESNLKTFTKIGYPEFMKIVDEIPDLDQKTAQKYSFNLLKDPKQPNIL